MATNRKKIKKNFVKQKTANKNGSNTSEYISNQNQCKCSNLPVNMQRFSDWIKIKVNKTISSFILFSRHA